MNIGVKKTMAYLLFVVLLVSLAGCTRQDMSQQDLDLQKMDQAAASSLQPVPQQKKMVLHLPAEDTGSRNPFSHAGSKLSVNPLLYQSLYTLDDDYIPQAVLASAMREEGRAYTITIQPDARFWDGTSVTAEDVVMSLREALKYPAVFPSLSRAVESCSVTEGGQVLILLWQEDRNASALFTFPICKSGTQSEPLPVGSGAFLLDSFSSVRMRRNPYYKSFEDASEAERISREVEAVELVPVADDEALEYMLKIGVIDFYFSADTDSDLYGYGSVERLTLNRMTFLGFNRSGNSLMRGDDLVQLIRSVLNKEQMVTYAYGSFAEPVDYPFHPGYWERINGDRLLEQTQMSAIPEVPPAEGAAVPSDSPPAIEEMMNRLGYTEKDESGFWIRSVWGGGVQRLSLRILINEENEPRRQMAQLLAEELANLGIECQLISESYELYLQSVAARRFDLYFGEIQMEANMDPSPLFLTENAGRLGFDYNPALEEAAAALKTGQMNLKGFLDMFDKAGIIEPICYQKGRFSYSRNLPGDFIALNRRLFLDIQNW